MVAASEEMKRTKWESNCRGDFFLQRTLRERLESGRTCALLLHFMETLDEILLSLPLLFNGRAKIKSSLERDGQVSKEASKNVERKKGPLWSSERSGHSFFEIIHVMGALKCLPAFLVNNATANYDFMANYRLGNMSHSLLGQKKRTLPIFRTVGQFVIASLYSTFEHF